VASAGAAGSLVALSDSYSSGEGGPACSRLIAALPSAISWFTRVWLTPSTSAIPRTKSHDASWRGLGVSSKVRAGIADLLAVQAPGLALGRRQKAAAPLAVAIRLRPHPRERARVIDDVRRCVDAVLDPPHELPMEAQEELRLVADEPRGGLLGDRTWRVVAGVLGADF
jgi:hypothetical protein